MTTNLKPNVASALCYVPWIGWVAAIVFLIVEKDKSVRFNAIQSILFGLAVNLAGILLGMTVILAFLAGIVWAGGIFGRIYLAVRIYNGGKIRLPVLSEWTDKLMKKF